MGLLVNILCIGAAAVWLTLGVAWMRGMARIPRLPRPRRDVPCPPVSIVIAACDEAMTIGPALRSVLDLDYPDLEIVVVDDRSTDGTGEILDRLARDHPRLKVVHIDQLPEGWVGKNHALHVGSQRATGEWLLFTDADVVFAPDALRRVVACLQDQPTDHLVLFPEMVHRGFWETAFTTVFSLVFTSYYRPWAAATEDPRAFIGVGAFNMVRRSVYTSFGGHAALRMDVIDDVKLGKLVKRHGFRQFVALADGAVSVRWQVGLKGLVRGLMKNSFAGVGYSWSFNVVACIGLFILHVLPFIGVAAAPSPAARLASLLVVATLVRIYLHYEERQGVPAPYVLAHPLAMLVMIYVLLSSATAVTMRGGVEWRGTFYSLRELRANQV